MATQQNGEDQQSTSQPSTGFIQSVEERYQKLKEHAETYPYVWASYAVVYGGFFMWTAYRWRKLRKTEDRVRALQEKLRRLVEKEDAAASSASSAEKASSSADKAIPK